MRRTCRGLAAVALLCALAVLEPQATEAASGSMRALGTLGGELSFGYAVNRRGQVAGASAVRSGQHHAFLWGERAGMIDLGTLRGGGYSEAYDLNNRGVVVGFSAVNSLDVHAFRWTSRTGMVDLGTLGGSSSVAYGVNVRGDVVGTADLRSGEGRAFLWTERGGMTSLGTLGGDWSIAYDVNDRGQVVGVSNREPGGEGRPFLWTPGAGMIDLGTLGGQAEFIPALPHVAKGINDRGDVAGYSLTSTGDLHAFLWTQGGGMVDLDRRAGAGSFANAINSRGDMAGKLSGGRSERAFLRTAGGAIMDLGSLDGGFSDAEDVNDKGQVTGTTSVRGGGFQAFLWSSKGG